MKEEAWWPRVENYSISVGLHWSVLLREGTRRKVSRWWNNRVEYGEGWEVGGRRRCRDAAVRRHIATAPSDWITR